MILETHITFHANQQLGKKMTFDNEQQKAFLIEMFKQVNIPGNVIEIAYSVLIAIKTGEVKDQSVSNAD